MNKGWKPLSLGAALTLVAMAGMPVAAPHGGNALAAARPVAKTGAAKSRNGLRQFTGVVTALDKTTITVEKGAVKIGRAHV